MHTTKKQIEKRKGSGVALLIKKEWNKHLIELSTPDTYSLRAKFAFKGFTLILWVVYAPPNDKETHLKIQQRIALDAIKKNIKTKMIIGGDLNTKETAIEDDAQITKGKNNSLKLSHSPLTK